MNMEDFLNKNNVDTRSNILISGKDTSVHKYILNNIYDEHNTFLCNTYVVDGKLDSKYTKLISNKRNVYNAEDFGIYDLLYSGSEKQLLEIFSLYGVDEKNLMIIEHYIELIKEIENILEPKCVFKGYLLLEYSNREYFISRMKEIEAREDVSKYYQYEFYAEYNSIESVKDIIGTVFFDLLNCVTVNEYEDMCLYLSLESEYVDIMLKLLLYKIEMQNIFSRVVILDNGTNNILLEKFIRQLALYNVQVVLITNNIFKQTKDIYNLFPIKMYTVQCADMVYSQVTNYKRNKREIKQFFEGMGIIQAKNQTAVFNIGVNITI